MTSLFAAGGVLLIRLIFFRITDVGLPKRRVLVLGNGDEAKRHHPGRGLVQEQQQVHRDDRAQIAPM